MVLLCWFGNDFCFDQISNFKLKYLGIILKTLNHTKTFNEQFAFHDVVLQQSYFFTSDFDLGQGFDPIKNKTKGGNI